APDRPAGGALLVKWPRENLPEGLGALGLRILDGDQAEDLAVVEHHGAEDGAAQLEGTCRDDVEYRLGIWVRSAGRPEHLAGGRLLFQGLLRLVEEAHILNGDHGLVGERR